MTNSNRGLASASEETRKQVASMGGKARAEQRGRNQSSNSDGGGNQGDKSSQGGNRNNTGSENGSNNRGRIS